MADSKQDTKGMTFRWFWTGVWNISEFTGVGLGRFAPFVFERMIGRKGHRVNPRVTKKTTEPKEQPPPKV